MVADDHDRRLLATKQELYELYWGEDQSTSEIADALDTTRAYVGVMLSQYGIPRAKSGQCIAKDKYADGWARTPLPSPYDAHWIHRQFRDNDRSLAGIADGVDAARATLRRALRDANLYRGTESFGDEPWQNREWLWRQFCYHRRGTGEVAVEQGISKRKLRYWADKHNIQRPDARWTDAAQASMQADGNEELPDAAKALDPTIKSKDTPDELINDTFAFGTNNAMGGRQGQR